VKKPREKETVNVQDAFVRDIVANPADRTPHLIFADWLEEQGQSDLAFTYRWMAAQGHWPGERKRKLARKPWAWWRPGSGESAMEEEDMRDIRRCPHAVLPWLIYHAVTGSAFTWYVYYPTWEAAVAGLEGGLTRLRAHLSLERKP
jgi:uncharacterized protein (TIGR02996 family)